MGFLGFLGKKKEKLEESNPVKASTTETQQLPSSEIPLPPLPSADSLWGQKNQSTMVQNQTSQELSINKIPDSLETTKMSEPSKPTTLQESSKQEPYMPEQSQMKLPRLPPLQTYNQKVPEPKDSVLQEKSLEQKTPILLEEPYGLNKFVEDDVLFVNSKNYASLYLPLKDSNYIVQSWLKALELFVTENKFSVLAENYGIMIDELNREILRLDKQIFKD
ncbi:MAG: hypothetical protein QXD62_01700 [Candidatus Woesearchaeota archaeon]